MRRALPSLQLPDPDVDEEEARVLGDSDLKRRVMQAKQVLDHLQVRRRARMGQIISVYHDPIAPHISSDTALICIY